MILFAFTTALAGLFLLLLFLITLVLLILAFGPVEVLVLLMMLSLVVVVGSVAAFLYVRTDIPSDVYHRINDALEQAGDSPEKEDPMTNEILSPVAPERPCPERRPVSPTVLKREATTVRSDILRAHPSVQAPDGRIEYACTMIVHSYAHLRNLGVIGADDRVTAR